MRGALSKYRRYERRYGADSYTRIRIGNAQFRLGAKDRAGRLTLAGLMAAIALGRFSHDPALWSAAVVMGEAVALFALARFTRDWAYAAIGAVQALVLAIIAMRSVEFMVPLELAMLGFGLVLFAVGVLVTFHKDSILALTRRPPDQPMMKG